jgi:hypothetical protein
MTLGSDAENDLYYRNGSGVLTRLANGTTGQVLTATTGSAPAWATGGSDPWTTYIVSGSDFTTTSNTLVNITGLVTGTLAVSKVFEFEAVLRCGTTAVATGLKFGANVTVAPTLVQYIVTGATTFSSPASTIVSQGVTGNSTTGTQAWITTASTTGQVNIKGSFETAAGGSPVFSLQVLKVTSGTATVFINSFMKIRQIN